MDAKTPEGRDRRQHAARQAKRREHRGRLAAELESTARRVRRRSKTASRAPQAAPPRAFALLACLFGDGCFLAKYVLGAVEIAAALKPPWSLWIAIDDAANRIWGEALRRLPNVHLVRIAPPSVEGCGTGDEAQQPRQRPKRTAATATAAINGAAAALRESALTATNNVPHLLARYVLLDDPRLAAAVVVDLDVHAVEAVSGHMALVRHASELLDDRLKTRRIWAATDLLRDEGGNSQQRLERTSGGVGRYNAGAIFMANALDGAVEAKIAPGIEAWVASHAEALGHGCDERWLEDAEHAPLVPALTDGRAVSVYVDGLRHGGESTLPRTHATGRQRYWCLGESSLGLRGSGFDASAAAAAIWRLTAAALDAPARAAHDELTGPSTRELTLPWLPAHTSGVTRGS